ncbi:MAG: SDR family oxidoreductase [Actinobacteria bacterium]|nr:SDR family oxidoreductase [Actinomycetota bacterium]
MGLENKVVVVTGASAGVGRACVRRFARKGARLCVIARGSEGLSAARAEAETLGARVIEVEADVSDSEAVEEAAQRCEAELGPIDIWVNNAMVSVFSPFKEMTPEGFRRVTDVTYHGYVYGTMAALKRMLPRDSGVIVQVGSALAYRGIPLQSAYCGAKHAIQGFSESLRCELLHDRSGVSITSVHLPAMNTPQFVWVRSRLPRHPQPVPPIYQPKIAARAIEWAALHPQRRELMVGWPTVGAIVADKFFAGLLDRYLARTGFDSQQTDDLSVEGRFDNLFEPVTEDQGARGPFSERAKERSWQLALTTHRREILVAAGLAGIAAATLRRNR